MHDAGPAAAPVHLVTVLYNSRDCLAAFAASLAAQDCRDWRLIAIDNASADGGAEFLSGLGDARISVVRNTANLGFARAANQGMRAALAADAAFVVLINNDTVLPADFLGRFIAARQTLQAAVITPRIMYLDRPGEAWYAGGHLDHGWVFSNVHEPYDPADTRAVRVVDFASGCCLGLTREVLALVGLLDERFFVYWEDTDFCLRLKQHGVPIHYLNDLVISHEAGHSSGGEGSPSFFRLNTRSYMQIMRKHFGFATAVRTALRLALKELQRREKTPQQTAAMLSGMARGLLLPPARP